MINFAWRPVRTWWASWWEPGASVRATGSRSARCEPAVGPPHSPGAGSYGVAPSSQPGKCERRLNSKGGARAQSTLTCTAILEAMSSGRSSNCSCNVESLSSTAESLSSRESCLVLMSETISYTVFWVCIKQTHHNSVQKDLSVHETYLRHVRYSIGIVH